jgi:hypothetical protein
MTSISYDFIIIGGKSVLFNSHELTVLFEHLFLY